MQPPGCSRWGMGLGAAGIPPEHPAAEERECHLQAGSGRRCPGSHLRRAPLTGFWQVPFVAFPDAP